ncbi:lipase [Streptomyces armeniacus]|uniref:Lipase n=1 Tax=Streptomyces armeniacus TaxID=83291 RepID=A0A345XWG8_9ACTN|nr:lipase family protein [Streptomyces armeniacus]AXK35984.1 lipase [Streptomyces armeniacus]
MQSSSLASPLGRAGAATAALALSVLGILGSAGGSQAQEPSAADGTEAGQQATADRQAKDKGTKAEDKAKSKAKAKGPESTAGPGDIVSSEPTEFQYWPGYPAAASAWKITYKSTTATGKENTVSGTVVVPDDGKTGPRPLIAYAAGSVGMGDKCAPSAGFHDGSTTEAPLINAALVRGFAVAVTDYEGLGTPGDHTYTVAQPAGTALLDAARAAQRLPEAQQMGVSAESPVGIMGYSQGGQASAWAAELHGSYAPELKVKGTASGGVPADLMKVATHLNGGDSAGYVMMSAIGHTTSFPELDLGKYLNDEGSKLAEFTKESCLNEILEAGKGKKIEDFTVSNPLEEPDWQQAVNANKLGTKTPTAPVFLYHGEADETIPYELGTGLRADWCAKGLAVEWKSFPGDSHVQAAIDGNGPALDWLGARFAGTPAQGNCGS